MSKDKLLPSEVTTIRKRNSSLPDLGNNGIGIFVNKYELVCTFGNTLLTIKEKTNEPQALLRKLSTNLLDLSNKIKVWSKVFENELYSTIVLFLLKNKIAYITGIRKLYPNKNRKLIKDAFEKLYNAWIIREVHRKEFIKEKTVFIHIIAKQLNASTFHTQFIKFYTLTDEAKAFFSSYEKLLEKVSGKAAEIENFRIIFNKTHEELKRVFEERNKHIQRCIQTTINSLNNVPKNLRESTLHRLAEIWSRRVLPKFAIFITPEEIIKMVGDVIEKKEN